MSGSPLQVAIIGSGISGLAAAHSLHSLADITLFEAGGYFGGHTHTLDITLPGPQGPVSHGVDTGFLVFNERTPIRNSSRCLPSWAWQAPGRICRLIHSQRPGGVISRLLKCR